MTLALPQQATESVAGIQHELEAAYWLPELALRQAVVHAEEVAPAIIDVVEKAANGALLLPQQENLLFWGIHVLGAARCTLLCRPLLRLIALDRDEYLDQLVGDAVTETLPRILISVFDGDAAPLFELCARSTLDGFLRWGLFDAIARLTFDNAIPRATTVEFLARFERENLAAPDDAAWQGWQDAIAHLGVEELYDRVRESWRDGRNTDEFGDNEILEEWFAEARALPPGDPTMFNRHGRQALDDAVTALRWTAHERHEKLPRKGSSSFDPAADVALSSREVGWLRRFLRSKRVPKSAMTLEQIDGFFCALIAGPTAPPSEYLPVIWDACDEPDPDCAPNFDNVEQQECVDALLARYWKTIRDSIKVTCTCHRWSAFQMHWMRKIGLPDSSVE